MFADLLQKHQEIMDTIQKIFVMPSMVRLTDWNKKFYLYTEASNVGIFGVLLEEHDQQFLPVA